MVEDTEVGNGTSPTTRSAQNLLLNMAEDVEVNGNGDGGNDKKVKRSSFSKKPNILTEYFISPRSRKKMGFS